MISEVRYPEIGICGLSCRVCPRHHTDGKSRCSGCKTETRTAAGCPFITCALQKKRVEFCGDCKEQAVCDRWKAHRKAGKNSDSFTCYQKLEENIAYLQEHGAGAFEGLQKERERLLQEMLRQYNEGRSKSLYCIAATVLEPGELKEALANARERTGGMDINGRSRALHAELDAIARQRRYCLKLRRGGG